MVELNQIAQTVTGPLSHHDLVARCNAWLERIFQSGDEADFEITLRLREHPDYLEEWKVYQSGVLELVSSESTLEGQQRKIREIILSGLEIAANALLFSGEGFSDDEKRALKKRIAPGDEDGEFFQLQTQGLIFATASADCMLCLAREFGDSKIEGWARCFGSCYATFAEKLLRAMLTDARLSMEQLGGAGLEKMKFEIDSLKVAILKGSDIEFERARQALHALRTPRTLEDGGGGQQ
jgi:hypothetical protein